ncbi:MAG TPA: CGNR zinc finger domain-containing protein [Candidatus Limnocylindrales bacterium]|nr:CGNR zinc finger domain-containing protein [Candidatus Limnocylindrales bacterium]
MTSRRHGIDHDHAIDLDGALEFINTLDLDDGQLVEHFVTPSDAAAWLREHGLIHDAEARDWAAADLDRTRAVRAALRDVVDSVVLDRQPAAGSIRLVNEVLDLGPRQQLELEDGAVRIGHRHVASPASEALVPIAGAIVDELATGRPDRFRICANDRCQWTFYDASPTGRRRWCDMSTCGNRAKAARHRARVRAAEEHPETASAGPAA